MEVIRPPAINQSSYSHQANIRFTGANATSVVGRVRSSPDLSAFYHLVCDCSTYLRNDWCVHTQVSYTTAYDSEDFFMPAQAIVVFSKDPWLIVPTLCINETESLYRVEALWGEPRRTGPQDFSAAGRDTIGYLDDLRYHRYEIRKMLLEWLPAVPDMYPDQMICPKSWHDPTTSYVDKRDIMVVDSSDSVHQSFVKHVLTDAFCRLDESSCLVCNTNAIIEVD